MKKHEEFKEGENLDEISIVYICLLSYRAAVLHKMPASSVACEKKLLNHRKINAWFTPTINTKQRFASTLSTNIWEVEKSKIKVVAGAFLLTFADC